MDMVIGIESECSKRVPTGVLNTLISDAILMNQPPSDKGKKLKLLIHSETEEPVVVYRALYGEGGLWVRPAEMWNESVERDGKIYHRFYRLDRIERVEKYERLFDEAATSHAPEKLRLLDEYYTSGEWREDYEADERGELPPDLKRGVLSQDALYNLLEKRGNA